MGPLAAGERFLVFELEANHANLPNDVAPEQPWTSEARTRSAPGASWAGLAASVRLCSRSNLRLTEHSVHTRPSQRNVELTGHLEPKAFVVRHVRWLVGIEVHRKPVSIGSPQPFIDEKRSNPRSLVGGIDAENGEVDVGFGGMVCVHRAEGLERFPRRPRQ